MGQSVFLQELIDVQEILDELKIAYWIDSGTLLGAVRDSNFIPWDNDIDIGVKYQDLRLILDHKAKFKQKGFRIIIASFARNIYLIQIIRKGPVNVSIYYSGVREFYSLIVCGPKP